MSSLSQRMKCKIQSALQEFRGGLIFSFGVVCQSSSDFVFVV